MTTACGRGHSNAPLKLTAGRTALAVVCLFCPASGRTAFRYMQLFVPFSAALAPFRAVGELARLHSSHSISPLAPPPSTLPLSWTRKDLPGPRLDIGRRVDKHVRPDTPALQGFAFARCCGFSSASIPHALTGKVGSGSRRFRPHAVAYDLWLPPAGSIRDLHPPPFIHARRTPGLRPQLIWMLFMPVGAQEDE